MDRETQRAIELLALATAPRPRLVVLTGAGASAASGLRTYRGPGGLYSDSQVKELLSAETLRRDPGAVVEHLNAWRETVAAAEPNRAHRALVRLEAALGRRLTLVTQNVDGLHERAGSRRVLAMHGDLMTARCRGRRPHIQPWEGPIFLDATCPVLPWRGRRRRPCGASLRHNVVLFGEPILEGEAVARAVLASTAFWAIGTSGTVTPAASLVIQAKLSGSETALFNLTPPGAEVEVDDEVASLARAAYDHVILGRAEETVPAAVTALLEACQVG